MTFRLVRPLYRDPYYAYEKQSNTGTGVISQLFGENLDPIYAQFGLRGHPGVDIPAMQDTEIYPGHGGWVNQLQHDPSKGIGVHILTNEAYDGFYYETLYWHCKEIRVQLGDAVTRATVIATVDNTGYSTGSHLHWACKRKVYQGGGQKDSSYQTIDKDNGYGGFIDPLQFLKPMADEYIIYEKEQFFRVSDRWYHIVNAPMLHALMQMGVISGAPKVESVAPADATEIAVLAND